MVFYIWHVAAVTLSQFGVRRSLNQYQCTFSQFWKSEVWNQGFPRAELPSEAPREGPSCLFQLLGGPQASVGLRPRPSSLCLHLHVISSMSPSLFCLLQGQGHPHLGWPHLTLITSAKILFPRKASFTGPGAEDVYILFLWVTVQSPTRRVQPWMFPLEDSQYLTRIVASSTQTHGPRTLGGNTHHSPSDEALVCLLFRAPKFCGLLDGALDTTGSVSGRSRFLGFICWVCCLQSRRDEHQLLWEVRTVVQRKTKGAFSWFIHYRVCFCCTAKCAYTSASFRFFFHQLIMEYWVKFPVLYSCILCLPGPSV